MKILFIEDCKSDAELTIRELTKSIPDCSISHVSTLHEARNELELNADYDLVLIDLHLPDGNGMEILEEIREKSIPSAVVILTGSGDEESVVTALKAGADDYIIKRTDYLESLPQTILSVINKYSNNIKRKAQEISVLYVEHDQSDIELTKRHFSRYAPHIRITIAKTAEDAVKSLPLNPDQSCKYDVLLLDYRLPGIDALEIIKIIRQQMLYLFLI
jgi:DNA-binding response OmpR family regulator